MQVFAPDDAKDFDVDDVRDRHAVYPTPAR